MRSVCIAPLALFCLVCTVPRASAQDEVYGADDGEWVVSLNGGWSYTENDFNKFERFMLFTSAGYFLSRHHEVGFLLAPTYDSSESKSTGDGLSTTVIDFSPYYQYNFWPGPKLNMYAGASLGVAYLDSNVGDSQTDFGFGLTVGMRYWLSTQIAINVQPRYTHFSFDEVDGGSQDNFFILFGLAARI